MSRPASGEPGAGTTGLPSTIERRSRGRSIGLLLAAGLALRLIIAYLLPGSGLSFDIAAFQYWAGNLADQGPLGFYDRGFFADYTPGYLYVLWLVGVVGNLLNAVGIQSVPAMNGDWTGLDLLKLPPIIADLVVGWLLWKMAQELGSGRRVALVAAALYVFNPITWFDSVVWGQVDSFGVVFLLLAVRELWNDRPERSALWATVAAVIKPQLGILVPIVAAVVIRRYLIDAEPGRRFSLPRSLRDLFRARAGFRVLTTAAVGLITATLLALPFGLTPVNLLEQVAETAGGYPYLTVNAFNPWALISQDGGGQAAAGTWIRDVVGPNGEPGFMFGPIPAVVVGTVLLLAAIVAISVIVARRPDRLTILVGVIALAVAFFVLPTRVHERYLFPFFALAAILAAPSRRWLAAYVAMGIATFANMYVVLTAYYPDNPGITDWLGLGEDLKSPLSITIFAMIQLLGFVWIAWQLRDRALTRLAGDVAASRIAEEELEPAVDERASGLEPPGLAPAPELGASALTLASDGDWAADERPLPPRDWLAPPPPDAPGVRASIARALLARPRRADRSAALAHESGGRLGRLDIWLLVILFLATLGLRTFRLDEPYSMHFDEVYHARTATEFLQDWRYGRPHDIYEYTHPHLAKYAMAAGIVAFGNNRVTGTADLGVPVRAVAIEQRWDVPALPDGRAGDRLYVATGSELRAYDLADRSLEGAAPLTGAGAVGVDDVSHRLFVGTDDGEIHVFDTSLAFDTLRTGDAPGDPMALQPTYSLGSVGAPITGLFVPPSGNELIVTTAGDEVQVLDSSSGEVLGRVTLPGVSDVVEAGSADQVIADPAAIADVPAAASLLAEVVGGDAAEIEARLAEASGPVIVAPAPSASERTTLDEAIADGRLAGVTVESVPLIAAIHDGGLSFLSSRDASVASEIEILGATGGAHVTGLEDPRIYVAAGDQVAVVRLPDDREAYVDTTLDAPGAVEDVLFDPSTNFVHVLGRTPDGTSPTIYVIEPHANAFFADAPLPFDPSTWVMDAQPRYPSEDRQAILTFDETGGVAEVDVGSNPFAWRLPGVIAGALLAALVYVLARILFRRRVVAVIAGLFMLLDGMMFVQSRIGMNDVYVALFIVAAYTLFAALWTGVWKQRWAFWVAMPAVGLLLGLGLASKWVALYAVAGVGILILARSALGRLLIVVAMIGATTVLGYMAISVPQGATSGGNLGFVLIMIALTLAAVLAAVLRPIQWTVEEVRFAVAAPVGLGLAMLLVAIPLGMVDTTITVSGLTISVLTVAGILAAVGGAVALAFWAAGRLGFGPLAPLPDPELGGPPPASPAPEGWLRLGSGWGVPAVWMAVCLGLVPIAVYVISYLPWVALGNRLTETWPPGNTGQTLLDLTRSMYEYHNNLRAAHAASSPWWAWPFDLKPVWFYQGGFAGNTAASIYDAGNLVIWWLGVPAMAFAAWQAWKRHSLGLGLIVIGFAFQYLTWVRIDRATFQYHYFTSLPFVVIGVAYFVAELWNGPSRATWLLARVAAAAAIVAPALLWVGKGPLCRFVRVEDVNPGSLACTGNPGDLVITARVAGLVLVMGVAVVALLYQLVQLQRVSRSAVNAAEGGAVLGMAPDERRHLLLLLATGVGAWIGIVLANTILDESVVYEARGFQSSYVALLVAIPLVLIAAFVITARDARRFATGIVFAALMAFLILYPNISALPLPSTIVNAYQGLLPTYLYPFQFPVNTDPAAPGIRLLAPEPMLLALALTVTCVVVGYAAWVWRYGPVARRQSGPPEPPLEPAGA